MPMTRLVPEDRASIRVREAFVLVPKKGGGETDPFAVLRSVPPTPPYRLDERLTRLTRTMPGAPFSLYRPFAGQCEPGSGFQMMTTEGTEGVREASERTAVFCLSSPAPVRFPRLVSLYPSFSPRLGKDKPWF